jgi:hypothetical protein
MNTNTTQPSRDQSHPSLTDEPFAKAMRWMPLGSPERCALIGERLLGLAEADRHELVDGYGDTHMSWWPRAWRGRGLLLPDPDPAPLATGFNAGAGCAELVLLGGDGEPLEKWEGPLAEALLDALGRVPAWEREVIRVPTILPVSEWEV